jgi:hypothetical protein
MIKIKLPGLKVFQNRLDRAVKRANEIPTMVQDEAKKVSAYSKSNAPVGKTGLLSRSHDFQENGGIKNGKYESFIEFSARSRNKQNLLYAPFQDFGTGKRFKLTSTLTPYVRYISGWKESDGSSKGIRPKKFLFHQYVLASNKIKRKTGTKVKNLMKT